MTTRLRSIRLRGLLPVPMAGDERPEGTLWLGRLIQVVLALYLIPVLLVVLVVGGIGMLVLAVARLLTAAWFGPAGWPRTPFEPASLSSRDRASSGNRL
jgi:hypothetical protein